MTPPLLRDMLRAMAIAIAATAAIDPAWSTTRPAPRTLVVVNLTSKPVDDVTGAVATALNDWIIVGRDPIGHRLNCAAGEYCVAIADGSVDADVGRDRTAPLSLLSMVDDGSPNVAIASAVASTTHAAAAGVVRVGLRGRGVDNRAVTVRVLDGATPVGSTSLNWAKGESMDVEVPWWPLGSGARGLRVEVTPMPDEVSAIDNAIDLGAPVTDARLPVLVFDARPSWSSTFVRRALEDDPRFAVQHRARIAPGLDARTPDGNLDARAVDSASLIIVGGIEALTEADATVLDRFVRVRGGSMLLLPEQRVSGAASRWFEGDWTEHLVATPEPVGPLRAGEMLRAGRLRATDAVIASAGFTPVIVMSAAGEGRIIVSGALDAWRHRDDSGAFDRLWRSLALEAAAAGERLTISFDRDLVPAGGRVPFTVKLRSTAAPAPVEASAVARCNEGSAHVVRLWPSGLHSEWSGVLPAGEPGACSVEIAAGESRGVAAVAVKQHLQPGARNIIEKLERVARASGGVVVTRGQEAALATAISGAAPPTTTPAHPMRNPWWLLPFAGCLSLEWWLRRRVGLR